MPEQLTSDPIDVLIASDVWGTRSILNICAALPGEHFHRKFEIGLGSLHDTLTHMISAMRRWTDRLAGRVPRPMLHTVPEFPHLSGEARERSPEELLALLDEAERDLARTVHAIKAEDRLGTAVTLDWPGKDGTTVSYTFSRGAVIVHVTTHGYHHRAQCLNMLRRLGAPVPGVTEGHPELSAVDWQAALESPGVVRNG